MTVPIISKVCLFTSLGLKRGTQTCSATLIKPGRGTAVEAECFEVGEEGQKLYCWVVGTVKS